MLHSLLFVRCHESRISCHILPMIHQVCDGRGCFIYRVLCCPFVLPLGMHSLLKLKTVFTILLMAKSRTPQQVISLISMDIPQMTVFELFELFESSQLVTSVGCLQNQTSLVTETVVPKDLACLLHLLFPLLP